jgi:hypothetical protein
MTFDLTFAVSMLLGLFGVATMWMATGHNERQRKFAPIVGLCAQFAWGWYAWLLGPKAGGLWILVALYAAVYARGAWVQWEIRRALWRRFGTPSDTQCHGCGREMTREEAYHYISHCERCEGIAWAEQERAS